MHSAKLRTIKIRTFCTYLYCFLLLTFTALYILNVRIDFKSIYRNHMASVLINSVYNNIRVNYGSYFIGKTGVKAPFSIEIDSAGFDCGNYSHMIVNGKDYSPDKRGMNVVVIDKGNRIKSRNFDIFLSREENSDFINYINSIERGCIVLLSTKDESSRFANKDTVKAVNSLGGTFDLRKKTRWCYLLIGVKGAAQGSSMELYSKNEAISLKLPALKK